MSAEAARAMLEGAAQFGAGEAKALAAAVLAKWAESADPVREYERLKKQRQRGHVPDIEGDMSRDKSGDMSRTEGGVGGGVSSEIQRDPERVNAKPTSVTGGSGGKSGDMSRTKRGSRAPSSVVPEASAWCLSHGIPEPKPGSEAASFLDYWCGVPGARGCKLDWPATWRNRPPQRGAPGVLPGLAWKAQQPEREGNPNPVSRRIPLPAASEVVRLLPGESPLSRALGAALPARSVRPEMMDDQREAERQRQLAELKNTNGAHG